jgi:hypothetical protein
MHYYASAMKMAALCQANHEGRGFWWAKPLPIAQIKDSLPCLVDFV